MCYFIILSLIHGLVSSPNQASDRSVAWSNQMKDVPHLANHFFSGSNSLTDTLPSSKTRLESAGDSLMIAYDQRIERLQLLQKKMYKEARQQFMQSVTMGDDPFSYYVLGYLSEKGYGGSAKLSEAQRWYSYAAQLNNPAATQKLISLYQSGRFPLANPAAEIERLRKNLEVGRKRFSVEAKQNDGVKILVNLFAEDFPEDPINPLAQEVRRIKEARKATPSPEVIASFNQLYKLAAEKGISFQGLYKSAALPTPAKPQNRDSLQTPVASKPTSTAPVTPPEIVQVASISEPKPIASDATKNSVAEPPVTPPTVALAETKSVPVPSTQVIASSTEPPKTDSPSPETKTPQPAKSPVASRVLSVDYSAKALVAIQKNQLDSLGEFMNKAVLTTLATDLAKPEQESKRLLDSLKTGSRHAGLLYYALGYLYEHKQSGKSWGKAERYYRYAFQTGYAPAYFRLLTYYTRETPSTSQTQWLQENYKAGFEAMPVQIAGTDRPVTLYIHDFPQDTENPIADECERLQETFGVAVPAKTIQRYTSLYRQAITYHRSFREQCKR